MREWLKQSHNQLAVAVWGTGLYFMCVVATSPIGIAERMQSPHEVIALLSAVLAVPVGWGVLKRQKWAKWIVVCIIVAIFAFQTRWVIAHRNVLMMGVQLLGLWGAVRFIRWDITGEAEHKRLMDRLHEFIEQNKPAPLAPSSVTLELISIPPLTRQSLAAAVESSFGRKCEISVSEDNIDLGVEAACTTHETAIVGGMESERFGHLIVGAHPIAMEVVWFAVDGDGSQDGLPISVLTIGTPRKISRTEPKIDGYDWTIPLAAALWTSHTRSATVDEEHLSFKSAEELLDWKTARLVSDS